MTDNFQRSDSAAAIVQLPEWTAPEVRRMNAGSAETDFNAADDGATQTS